MKRVTWTFANVPPSGQPASQLSSITFTSPEDGTALATARGYCNQSGISGATNEINISIGTGTTVGGLVDGWGVMRIPAGAPVALHQVMWSAQTSVAVTAGTPVTLNVNARHQSGNVTDDCSGSLWVEVYTGVLP
jgi:hypothetical protein